MRDLKEQRVRPLSDRLPLPLTLTIDIEIEMWLGCADCGFRGHPAALDFDHVRGIKLFNIGPKGLSKSMATLLAELEKCEVVCANCHRIRTETRRAA